MEFRCVLFGSDRGRGCRPGDKLPTFEVALVVLKRVVLVGHTWAPSLEDYSIFSAISSNSSTGMAAAVKKEMSARGFKAIEACMASAIRGSSAMITTSYSPRRT